MRVIKADFRGLDYEKSEEKKSEHAYHPDYLKNRNFALDFISKHDGLNVRMMLRSTGPFKQNIFSFLYTVIKKDMISDVDLNQSFKPFCEELEKRLKKYCTCCGKYEG